jgi:hypothetical protein
LELTSAWDKQHWNKSNRELLMTKPNFMSMLSGSDLLNLLAVAASVPLEVLQTESDAQKLGCFTMTVVVGGTRQLINWHHPIVTHLATC